MIAIKIIVFVVAISAILAYTVGISPSFSAEYSKSTQSASSANDCGNPQFPSSEYEILVEDGATYCANTGSEIQGEENTVGATSSQQ